MGFKTIKLTDEAFKKLEMLADDLDIPRWIDINNIDTHDWFVELLTKISKEQIDMTLANRIHMRIANRARSRGIEMGDD